MGREWYDQNVRDFTRGDQWGLLTAVEAPTNGQCVLVVDDDEAFCRALARLLTRAGYVVASAHTIARGLELAVTTRPNVIILDRRIGAEDGAQLLAHLRLELGSGAPPVLMCSSDGRDLKGAAAVLRKPFDPAELLDTIGGLIPS